MNKRRLLKLADLLESDAANPKGIKFDLRMWGSLDEQDDDDLPKVIPIDCGTTACAIGLACISGAFKDEGLTYSTRGELGGNAFVPSFGRFRRIDAVERFFEIEVPVSAWLFYDFYYDRADRSGQRGELAVAKRIRDFVAGKARP